MVFLSWDILSHYTKMLVTLQQKVINGFCKLYLEARTGYHPKEKNIIGILFPEPIKSLICFQISHYILQF